VKGAAALLLLAAAAAADEAEQGGGDPVADLLRLSRLGPVRERLGRDGMELEAVFVEDLSVLLSGGVDSRRSVHRGYLFVGVALDGEALLGWRGGAAFADFQWHAGRNGSDFLGDFQFYDNQDEREFAQVAQAWLEQRLFDERLRVRVGKLDFNSEFALPRHGSEFLNSSAAISPAILSVPAYADTSFGAHVFVRPLEGARIGVAVQDGAFQEGVDTGARGPRTLFDAPADLFLAAEISVEAAALRLAAGAWRHTGAFDRFDGGIDRSTHGLYAIAEAALLDGRVLAFAQLGSADADVSEARLHAGGGVTLRAPFACRPKDACGIGATRVWFSPQAGTLHRGETAIEVVYRLQLTESLAWLLDLQHVIDPYGSGAADAWVVTFRMEVVF
jgi:porin